MSPRQRWIRWALWARGTTVGRKMRHQWRETRDSYLEGRHGQRPERPGEDSRSSSTSHSGGERSGAGKPGKGDPGTGDQGWDPQLAEWYANLELPYGADLEAVTRAWRRMLRRYHPDRHAAAPDLDRQATELTRALNQAHEGLRRHLEGRR